MSATYAEPKDHAEADSLPGSQIQNLIDKISDDIATLAREPLPTLSKPQWKLSRTSLGLLLLVGTLTVVLNTLLVNQRANYLQLGLCNFGSLILCLLVGISVLNDLSVGSRETLEDLVPSLPKHAAVVKQLVSLAGVHEDWRRQSEQLEACVHHQCSIRDELENEQSILRESVALLQQKASEAAEDRNASASQSSQARESLAELEASLESLREEERQTLDRLSTQHSSLADLELKITESNRCLESKNSEIEAKTLEYQEISTKLDKNSEELSKRAQDLDAADKNLLTKSGELEAVSLELQRVIAECEAARLEKTRSESELASMQTEIERISVDVLSQQHNRIDDLQRTKGTVEHDVVLAEEALKAVAGKIAECEQELATKQAELEQVSENLSSVQSNLATLQQREAEQLAFAKSAEEKAEEQKSQWSNAEQELKAAKMAIEELSSERLILIGKQAIEAQEYTALKDQLEKSRQDFSSLSCACTEELGRLESIKNDQKQLLDERQVNTAELAQLLEQQAHLRSMLESLEVERCEAEACQTQLNHEIETQRIEYEKASDQFSESILGLKHQVSEEESRLNRLHDKQRVAAEHVQQATGELERIQRSAAEATMRVERLGNKADQLASQVEMKAREIFDHKQELISLRAEAKQFELAKREHESVLVATEQLRKTQVDEQRNLTLITDKRIAKETQIEQLNQAQLQLESLLQERQQKSADCIAEIARNQDLLESLKREQEDVNRELSDLRAEINDLQGKSALERDSIQQLTEVRTEIESELVQQQTDLEQTRLLAADLQQRIVDSKNTIGQLSQEITRRETLKQENEAIAAQLVVAHQDALSASHTLEQLKIQLAATQDDSQAAGRKSALVSAQIESLRGELDALAAKKVEGEKALANISHANGLAEANQADLQETIAKSRKDLQQASAKLLSTQQEISKCEKDLKNHAAEVEDAQKACEQWREYGEKLQHQNQSRQDSLHRIESQIKSLTSDRISLESAILKLRSQADASKQEALGCQQQVHSTNEMLMAARHDLEHVAKSKELLQRAVRDHESELKSLQIKIDGSNRLLGDLATKEKQRRTILDDLRIQQQTRAGELQVAANELESKRIQLADCELRHSALLETLHLRELRIQELTALTGSLESRRLELARITESHNALQLEENKMRGRIAQLTDATSQFEARELKQTQLLAEFTRLEKEYKELRSNYATAQDASVLAQAELSKTIASQQDAETRRLNSEALMAELRSQCDSLKEKQSGLTRSCGQSARKLRETVDELNAAELEKSRATATVANLEAELARLESFRDEKLSELHQLSKQEAALLDSKLTLEGNVTELMERQHQLDAANSRLLGETRDLERQNIEAKTALNAKHEEWQKRQSEFLEIESDLERIYEQRQKLIDETSQLERSMEVLAKQQESLSLATPQLIEEQANPNGESIPPQPVDVWDDLFSAYRENE